MPSACWSTRAHIASRRGGTASAQALQYSVPPKTTITLLCHILLQKALFTFTSKTASILYFLSPEVCTPYSLIQTKQDRCKQPALDGGVVTSKKSEPEVWFVCHSKSTLHRLISVRVKLNLCHNAKSNKTLTRTTPQIAISLVLHLILSIAALAGWHEMYLYGQVLQQDCCKRPTPPGVFRKSAAITG